jgi:tetratricopeptide (TPR) repeat protein
MRETKARKRAFEEISESKSANKTNFQENPMKAKTAIFFLVAGLTIQNFFAPSVMAQELSEPEKNFEYLWQTFDRNYAIFGAKSVDWNVLYKIYRPRVTSKTSDDELFDIMASLIGHLNDNHVRLSSPNRNFQSGILGEMKMEDFSLDLVKEKYLKGKFQQRRNGVFHYGWLNDSIGYFHFRGFGQIEESTAAIDEIIREFKDAKGIVVDVRSNGGGDDMVGKLIADRFADRKRLYMKTQIRNGPKHDDFTQPKYWYVEPDGPIQFTKPVILLTHRFSVSAAENFALAMRVLPHVTVVGDSTSGVFADVYGDRLPNGWRFSVSFKLFVDQNGFCWEGIGVPMDIRQTNTKKDIEQKRDKVLDLAVSLIESGALKPQNESSSLRDIRESLAKNLERAIASKEIEDALAAFNKAKAGNPNSYYLDEEEMQHAGERLWGAGKKREALEVFKITAREFPKSYQAHERLAEAYTSQGNSNLAQAHYKKAVEFNRRSYPWEKQSYEDAQRAAAGTKLLSKTLASDIEDKGIEAAVKAFNDAKSGGPNTYYIDEGQINQLGYQFLRRGKTKEAIAVFEINAREFPNSSNVYDSLGEAYMNAGQKEMAIKNYRKSVELNPRNTNAVDIIKKLESPTGKIDPKVYDAYVGQYESPLGIIHIIKEGDKLYGMPEGAAKEELVAESESRFNVPGAGAQVGFFKDESGQITHMVLRINGQEIKARKVK